MRGRCGFVNDENYSPRLLRVRGIVWRSGMSGVAHVPSNNRDLWEICLASGDGDVMLLSGLACVVSLCARAGCWKVGMGRRLMYM